MLSSSLAASFLHVRLLISRAYQVGACRVAKYMGCGRIASMPPCFQRLPMSSYVASSSSPDFYESIQSPVKLFAPDRHLHCVEWVLHHIVCIQLVYLLHHCVHIRLLRLREEEELHSRLCLKALYAEMRAFQNFNAGRADWECLETRRSSRRRRRTNGRDGR